MFAFDYRFDLFKTKMLSNRWHNVTEFTIDEMTYDIIDLFIILVKLLVPFVGVMKMWMLC